MLHIDIVHINAEPGISVCLEHMVGTNVLTHTQHKYLCNPQDSGSVKPYSIRTDESYIHFLSSKHCSMMFVDRHIALVITVFRTLLCVSTINKSSHHESCICLTLSCAFESDHFWKFCVLFRSICLLLLHLLQYIRYHVSNSCSSAAHISQEWEGQGVTEFY